MLHEYQVPTVQACRDRGSKFRPKWVLNGGAPQPKIVDNKDTVLFIIIVVYLGRGIVSCSTSFVLLRIGFLG